MPEGMVKTLRKSLSEATRKRYREVAKEFMQWERKNPKHLTIRLVLEFLAMRRRSRRIPLKAATLRTDTTAIKRCIRARGGKWSGELDATVREYIRGVEREDAEAGRKGTWEDGTAVGQARALMREEVCVLARDQGRGDEVERHQIAVMWKLGLRVAEACAIQREDVTWNELGMFVRIARQKNGKGFVYLAVPIDDKDPNLNTQRIMARRVATTVKGGWIFGKEGGRTPTNPERFRQWLKRVAQDAGLRRWDMVNTHSCRAGFAVDSLLRGVHIETIMHRGRWASRESMAPYLRYNMAIGIAREDWSGYDSALQMGGGRARMKIRPIKIVN